MTASKSFFHSFIQSFIAVLFIIIVPVLVSAHGIQLNLREQSPFVMVHAHYHGGGALAGASVSIVAVPDREEIRFQEGETDANGKFAFLPDKPGQWKVTVDDQMGHRKSGTIEITGAFFNREPANTKPAGSVQDSKKMPLANPASLPPAPQEEESGGMSCCYILKIIAGVFFILLLTFGSYYLKKKRGRNA